MENVNTLIIDGVITQRILDIAKEKSIKLIAGAVMGHITKKPHKIEIMTFKRY